MIIKTEDFEFEISIGTDVYFASKQLGQNFKKWDDLEDNEKLKLEIIKKKFARLILESKEIDDNKLSRERRSGIDRREFSFEFFIPERRKIFDRRQKIKSIRLMKAN
jgi:hypothetical protein